MRLPAAVRHAAILATSLLIAADGQAQLLPFGEFAARDGRPGIGKTWTVTNERGAQLATELSAVAAKTPIVIDYDHQTINTITNGQAAPAAGWIKSATWRDGVGLFCAVEWTARAKAYIDAGEYRYISPVLAYDDAGNVTGLLIAALVNYPALTGMEPVVAQLSALYQQPLTEPPKMTTLIALCAMLGLAATTTEADALAAVRVLKEAPAKAPLTTALSAALGLQAGADEAAALSAVAALKTQSTTPDATTLQTMQLMQTNIAALTAQIAEGNVTKLVDGAIADHKLLPAQRDWALGLGKANFAALTGYLATAVPMQGMGGQGAGAGAGGEGGTAALSAAQHAIASALGLDLVKYAEKLKAAA